MAKVIRKRKSVSSQKEEMFATGAIVSDKFLEVMKPLYLEHGNKIKNLYVRTVVGWCYDFFDKAGSAPLEAIRDRFAEEQDKLDEGVDDLIEAFLDRIDDEIERADKFNENRYIVVAQEYLRRVAATTFVEDLKVMMGNEEDPDKIEEYITSYKRTSISKWDLTDAWDPELMFEAWAEEKREPLFSMKGALGYYYNQVFVRTNFVSLIGVEKRGKSWWLLEIAARAWFSGCNVLFISIADMEDFQIRERIAQRRLKIVRRDKMIKYPVLNCRKHVDDECGLPYREDEDKSCLKCLRNRPWEFEAETEFVEKEMKRPDPEWVRRKARDVMKGKGKTRAKASRFRIERVTTFSVSDLDRMLDNAENHEGWVPDVIVVDYADLFSPENGSRHQQMRHIIDEQWRRLRGIALERCALVVTATQAASTAYGKDYVTQGDFSESKTKLAHVTHMIGLNQTEEEKQNQQMRWSSVLGRDFEEMADVCVLQCLDVGQINIVSFPNKEEHEDHDD